METEEAVEEATADADMWKDFCIIEEEAAKRYVCELEGSFDDDVGEVREPDDIEDETEVLDPEKVAAARAEEVSYMNARGLWDVVPVPPGVHPVSVRWVDVVKSDGSTRSRLVARDFRGRDGGRDDLFAATPPLEAFGMILSRAATETISRERRKVVFIDAKKAHLNPRCREEVFIQLPDECQAPTGTCGRLNYWLYGFRRAATEWEQHYASLLETVGFVRGVGCPVVFVHRDRDLALAVHGDDFVATGFASQLTWLAEYLASCFDIKVRATLGQEQLDDKEVVMLGRTVRWTSSGLEIEADPKHR